VRCFTPFGRTLIAAPVDLIISDSSAWNITPQYHPSLAKSSQIHDLVRWANRSVFLAAEHRSPAPLYTIQSAVTVYERPDKQLDDLDIIQHPTSSVGAQLTENGLFLPTTYNAFQ
jgi:hypothetical protein